MNKITFTLLAITAIFLFPVNTVTASDQEINENDTKQQVYGSELMSIEELATHRAKIRSLNSELELQAYRNEHHKLMQARATEKGVTLPEMPMMQGGGKGRGQMHMDGNGSGLGLGRGPMDGSGPKFIESKMLKYAKKYLQAAADYIKRQGR